MADKRQPIDRVFRRVGVRCTGGNQKGKIKAVVLHSTESPAFSAEGAASYLKGRTDGSVQLVVDDNEAYRIANDSTIVCGAGGYNTGVVHIEQAGYAHWSRKQWMRRERELQRAAFLCAAELRKHGLKPKVLKTRAELEHGGGYSYHMYVSEAGFPTTHTDPGPHYPTLRMHAYIRFFFNHPKAKRFTG